MKCRHIEVEGETESVSFSHLPKGKMSCFALEECLDFFFHFHEKGVLCVGKG